MQVFEAIARLAVGVVASFSYAGVFLLMAMESMVIPVPSELVMPLVGFLASRGAIDFWLAVFVSAFGSIAGSLASYWIGKKFGEKAVIKYGKFFFLDETHLRGTEEWLARDGDKAIFVSRFIPVVRHLVSIPAGIGKMNVKKFTAYTFAGAAIWNAALAFAGFELGANWGAVRSYLEPISLAVIVILVVAVVAVFFLLRQRKVSKKTK